MKSKFMRLHLMFWACRELMRHPFDGSSVEIVMDGPEIWRAFWWYKAARVLPSRDELVEA